MPQAEFDLGASARDEMLHEAFDTDFPPETGAQLAALRRRRRQWCDSGFEAAALVINRQRHFAGSRLGARKRAGPVHYSDVSLGIIKPMGPGEYVPARRRSRPGSLRLGDSTITPTRPRPTGASPIC